LPVHDAPGEAEAECALLQKRGIVDAVLSEDVDTLMFGCTRTLRNWTAEGKRGSNAPTHVTMYESHGEGLVKSGLGKDGMVLVALMSGGDYIPAGVPGCGVKLACEIARAGFGDELCRLEVDDLDGLAKWRARLKHELVTNESRFFRTRHKSLTLPETFPDLQVLRYYTQPAVSSIEAIDSMAQRTNWRSDVDIAELQEFVRKTFDWTGHEGAVKLIRVLSPSMLVQSVLHVQGQAKNKKGQVDLGGAPSAILDIRGQRTHWTVDGMAELRVSYLPASLVPISLSSTGSDGHSSQPIITLDSDEDNEPCAASQGVSNDGKGSSKSNPSFDPLSPQTLWLPEHLARLGSPLAVDSWKQETDSKTGHKQQHRQKATTGASQRSQNQGSLDSWARTSKTVDHPDKSAQVRCDAALADLVVPSVRYLSHSSQTSSQRRMLHSRAITSTDRSKPSKPSARAGVTDLRALSDARMTRCSQPLRRDADTDTSPAVEPASDPQPAWPPPPVASVRHTPGNFEPGPSAMGSRLKDSTPPNRRGVADMPASEKKPLAKQTSDRRRKVAVDHKQADMTSFLKTTKRSSYGKELPSSKPETTESSKPQKSMVALFVPCADIPGFLRQVEVNEDEACTLLGDDQEGQRVGARKAWRHSNMSIIDLTGD
jgi:holliday junction resolvase GEN1/YEN1